MVFEFARFAIGKPVPVIVYFLRYSFRISSGNEAANLKVIKVSFGSIVFIVSFPLKGYAIYAVEAFAVTGSIFLALKFRSIEIRSAIFAPLSLGIKSLSSSKAAISAAKAAKPVSMPTNII